MPHAEDNGEGDHQQGDDEGRVLPDRHIARIFRESQHMAGEGFEAERHGLQLQRDIGHGADHGDEGRQDRDGAAAAIAGAEEVGDRSHVLLLRNCNNARHDRPGENDDKGRADIDQREIEAIGDGAADRPVERPGRAIDRERKRIDDRPETPPGPTHGMPLAGMGDDEEQAQIGQREHQDEAALRHAAD